MVGADAAMLYNPPTGCKAQSDDEDRRFSFAGISHEKNTLSTPILCHWCRRHLDSIVDLGFQKPLSLRCLNFNKSKCDTGPGRARAHWDVRRGYVA